MNARTSTRNITVTREEESVTNAVCKLGVGVVFAFAAVVGIISFVSLASGLVTAAFMVL